MSDVLAPARYEEIVGRANAPPDPHDREREGYFLTAESWKDIEDVRAIRNEAEESWNVASWHAHAKLRRTRSLGRRAAARDRARKQDR